MGDGAGNGSGSDRIGRSGNREQKVTRLGLCQTCFSASADAFTFTWFWVTFTVRWPMRIVPSLTTVSVTPPNMEPSTASSGVGVRSGVV